jgi:hypothetical protein
MAISSGGITGNAAAAQRGFEEDSFLRLAREGPVAEVAKMLRPESFNSNARAVSVISPG